MSLDTELTTLVCLFHHADQAQAALKDLRQVGIPQASITILGARDGDGSSLSALNIPSRDYKHLADGLRDGGTIIAVSAITDHVDAVEDVFGQHKATKIDESVTDDDHLSGAPIAAAPIAAAPAAVADTSVPIPVVEEQLQVGKRTVDQGGVRVFRRVVEIPVQQSVQLREEHVVIERKPVDRPTTQADLDAQKVQSIELIETAEEAVIGKTAHVVEEVVIGKQTSERTEHIQDTVRRTEVEIEEVPASTDTVGATRSI